MDRSSSPPSAAARCRRLAAAWCAVTLLVSVVVEYALPANGLQFALGMWSPALVAIAFLVAERTSLREGLNLRRGSGRAWQLAVAVPCATALLTASIGVATGEFDPYRWVETPARRCGPDVGDLGSVLPR